VGIVGVGYVALEFIPSIEPPANMRYVLAGATTTFAVEILTWSTAMPMPAGAPNKSNRATGASPGCLF
jgi:hypothetical protein